MTNAERVARAREILDLLRAGTATDADRDEVLIILLELGV